MHRPAGAAISRVVIAEGNVLVRKGLASLIQAMGKHEVVAECGTLASAMDEIRRLEVDLLVMGASIFGETSTDLVPVLRSSRPAMRTLLVCSEQDGDVVRHALVEGLCAIANIQTTGEDLARAVDAALQGHSFVEARLARTMAVTMADERRQSRSASDTLRQLTARERQVFDLIAAGHTNRTAAEALGVSPKTIEKHRAIVMQKLKLRSAVDLRLLAMEAKPLHPRLALGVSVSRGA